MEKNEVITLEDRGFIQVNGSEAKDFLQNIVTSNVEKATTNSTVFSSILLILFIIPLDIPISVVFNCPSIKHLPFFKIRSKEEGILELFNIL